MQKFGLQTHRSPKNSTLDLEIAREQATSLGRAGKKLRLSLENYEHERHSGLSEKEELNLIYEISQNVWALMLQREILGFIEGNMKWVRENYVIPDAAINTLGKQKPCS